MKRYMKKPYGWMPRPFKLKCPICGNEIPYIASEGDSDWAGKPTILHIYECDECRVSVRHHIQYREDDDQ
jgi:hypothetical protein